MAGDWIKIEKRTPRKVEILRIAEILSIHPDHALGVCVRFWSWCDDHLVDGKVPVSASTLDSILSLPGISHALLEVDWLRSRSGSLEVPHFARHLGHSPARHVSASSASDDPAPRPVTSEKPPAKAKAKPKPVPFVPSEVEFPPILETPEFRQAWLNWVEYRKSKRKPLSQMAVSKQIGELVRWAESMGPAAAVESIEQSIRCDWTGLFAPRIDQARPGKCPEPFGGIKAWLASKASPEPQGGSP